MKQEFIRLLRSTEREGIENLIAWLDNETDFFIAPASTKHHGAHEGGLLEHSMAVFRQLENLVDHVECKRLDNVSQATLIICGLLHDICKTNFYKNGTRNVKNPVIDSKQLHGWHEVQSYSIEDQLPLGHGEKSVMLLQRFIRPTVGEVMAINWHMAGFDARVKDYAGQQALSNAMKQYPLITALHAADLFASYFNEA